ncbi:hypothetical protein [Thalassotalea atypica]|uniref:hypothetical protein n=1 Tax=Thalassotalea atypica TaxID=2054316 RepID=UPI0025734517|nr:hypothetical protein [Thalassotalea atypica]
MKVTEKGNYLIITSYPLKFAWICLLSIFLSIFAGAIQLVDQVPILLGVTIPTLILFIFDFKLTIFDFNNREMLQTNYSITGKRALTVPFNEIFTVAQNTANGLAMTLGCVQVLTHENSYQVTAISDASAAELSNLVTKLKHLLKIS